jgi:hypothetical protein
MVYAAVDSADAYRFVGNTTTRLGRYQKSNVDEVYTDKDLLHRE